MATKPFFREPFKTKRCLTPVSGCFEWQDTPGGKQPWDFTARDGSRMLTVANMWDEWKNKETGDWLKSCAMIIAQRMSSSPRSTIVCRSSCSPRSSTIG